MEIDPKEAFGALMAGIKKKSRAEDVRSTERLKSQRIGPIYKVRGFPRFISPFYLLHKMPLCQNGCLETTPRRSHGLPETAISHFLLVFSMRARCMAELEKERKGVNVRRIDPQRMVRTCRV
jgi:hypothetical protein